MNINSPNLLLNYDFIQFKPTFVVKFKLYCYDINTSLSKVFSDHSNTVDFFLVHVIVS